MKPIVRTQLIPRSQSPYYDHGFANGYVGVSSEHPWYGKGYDDVEVSVHGGLTYADDHVPYGEPDGLWWLGFDTAHAGDTLENWPQWKCEKELADLKEQALAAIPPEAT